MDTSGYMIERATPAVQAADTLDETAFRLFYQRHARAVWSYLYRVTGNAAQADDVMQEAFCRFLTAPVGDLDESEQRAYVFRIASNLAIDHWRRARREEAIADHPDRPEPAAPGA